MTRTTLSLLAALAMPLSACVGTLDGGPLASEPTNPGDPGHPGDPGTPDPSCTGLCVQRSRMSRITSAEYDNSVLDVLGVDADTGALPADGAVAHFASNEFVEPGESDADRFELVASAVAASFVASESFGRELAAVPECASHDAACATELAARWGSRLYRRDLDTDELAAYAQLFVWATESGSDPDLTDGLRGSFEDGIRLLVMALLQSPNFLFVIERGTPTEVGGVVALGPAELAARLSRLVFRSVPDSALLEAARTGRLSSEDDLERELRRMLDDPRSDRMWLEFAREWLDTGHLDSVPVATPPEGQAWDAGVVAALDEDFDALVLHVLRDGDGRLETLLTSEAGQLSDPRAAWVMGTSTLGWNEHIPSRHGLITTPAVLVANGRPSFSRPHWRGLFVRERLLCQIVPPPDPSLAASIATLRSNEEEHPSAVTTRARLDTMTANEPCASCHRLTNPIGYGLDRFDGFGRARTAEIGSDGAPYAIDTSGTIAAGGSLHTDVDGPFADTDALLDRLASSESVARCTTLQLARFTLQREASQSEDAPSVSAAYGRMAESGGDLREALVALVRSDAFRHRRLGEP